jgi:hypothetical protein
MSFVPDDFVVPRSLVCAAFRLEPLGPEHNEGDYRAWMSSIEHIRATPGWVGRSWPRPDMTLAENLGDLERHAADFAARSGFTYTVRDARSDEIFGCVYIYPAAGGGSGASSGASSDGASGASGASGAEVRSWVSADRASLDVALYEAVSAWLRSAWPFTTVTYAPRVVLGKIVDS